MSNFESWIVVVVTLYVLGLVAPVTGALRAWRRGVETLRKIDREQERAAELEAEWAAKLAALPASFDDAPQRQNESRADATARLERQVTLAEERVRVGEGRVAAFAAEGLIAPTYANLASLPAVEARRALKIVLDGNRWNLALVLTGPVLATAASIIALFPPG